MQYSLYDLFHEGIFNFERTVYFLVGVAAVAVMLFQLMLIRRLNDRIRILEAAWINRKVGEVTKVEFSADGLFITGEITDKITADKISSGITSGLSIGPSDGSARIINEARLISYGPDAHGLGEVTKPKIRSWYTDMDGLGQMIDRNG